MEQLLAESAAAVARPFLEILPLELWLRILHSPNVDKSDLARCALVCKIASLITRPLLFDEIVVHSRARSIDGGRFSWQSIAYRERLEQRIQYLSTSGALALVRSLKVVYLTSIQNPPPNHWQDLPVRGSSIYASLLPLVPHLTNLQSVDIQAYTVDFPYALLPALLKLSCVKNITIQTALSDPMAPLPDLACKLTSLCLAHWHHVLPISTSFTSSLLSPSLQDLNLVTTHPSNHHNILRSLRQIAPMRSLRRLALDRSVLCDQDFVQAMSSCPCVEMLVLFTVEAYEYIPPNLYNTGLPPHIFPRLSHLVTRLKDISVFQGCPIRHVTISLGNELKSCDALYQSIHNVFPNVTSLEFELFRQPLPIISPSLTNLLHLRRLRIFGAWLPDDNEACPGCRDEQILQSILHLDQPERLPEHLTIEMTFYKSARCPYLYPDAGDFLAQLKQTAPQMKSFRYTGPHHTVSWRDPDYVAIEDELLHGFWAYDQMLEDRLWQ